jgi:hypothetical protein
MIQQFNAALDKIEGDDTIRGVVVTGAGDQSVIDRAFAVATASGVKKPRLFASYKQRFRGETADCMLAEDLRYIEEEMDIAMFQNCDLSCLQSLP